jgi:bifunctional non-homologous end joining protein LigD
VFEGDGDILFEHACKLGCEGIVSKRLGSPHRLGRSRKPTTLNMITSH